MQIDVKRALVAMAKALGIVLCLGLFHIFMSMGMKESKEISSFFTSKNPEFYQFVKRHSSTIEETTNELAAGRDKQKKILADNKEDILDIMSIIAYSCHCQFNFVNEASDNINIDFPVFEFQASFSDPVYIDICNVKINRIPEKAFAFFDDVVGLRMEKCELTDSICSSLPELSKYLPALTFLDLSENELRNIPDVSNFGSLKKLVLNKNLQLTVPDPEKVMLFPQRGHVHLDHTSVNNKMISALRKTYKRINFHQK